MEDKFKITPKKMRNIPAELDLPIFLLSRLRIPYYRPGAVSSFYNWGRKKLAKSCAKVDENLWKYEQEEQKKCAREDCIWARSIGRTEKKPISYHLPPTWYNVPLFKPSNNNVGWKVIHKSKRPKSIIPTCKRRYYKKQVEHKNIEYDSDVEPMPSWGKDRRNLQATERFIISQLRSCWRNETDPAPNYVFPKQHQIDYKINTKAIHWKTLSESLYQKYFCVPNIEQILGVKGYNFKPGPGHYNPPIAKYCPCPRRNMKRPATFADHIKARRLEKLLCAAEFRHIIGGGFTRLFKSIPRKPQYTKIFPNKIMKIDFIDHKYRAIILYPNRRKYCLSKHKIVTRRSSPSKVHFRNIKGKFCSHLVAFGTRKERFPETRKIFSKGYAIEMAAKAKMNLPEHLKIVNCSVTKTPLHEIQSRLFAIPQKYKPTKKIKKFNFKFQPLPERKLLVPDVGLDFVGVEEKAFYYQEYAAEDFFN